MTIKDKLYEPFDNIDTRQGRGGHYDYVKWQNVADRMNEVFGIHWSSEIMWSDMIGENLVVRVKVCVQDPETSEYFCQEGFGGAVARAGDEAGTAHKSAYSKALKDACKKWGVGLHLEDTSNTSTKPNIPQGYTGYETGAPTPPATPNVQAMPSAPATPSAPAPQAPAAPATPQASAPQMPSTPTYAAPPAQSAPAPQAPATPSAPAQAGNMGLPPTPAPAGINQSSAPAVPSAPATPSAPAPQAAVQDTNPDTPGTITEVQDMAIKNLVKLNGSQDVPEFLQGLVANPECELNRPVATLNELSYNEAVCVIRAAKSLS